MCNCSGRKAPEVITSLQAEALVEQQRAASEQEQKILQASVANAAANAGSTGWYLATE